MTAHPADSRASAWIGAHERIIAAQKLKVDRTNHLVEPLPEIYWAAIAEAAVLAQLATADQTTGLHAGGYLVDQHERIEENRARDAVTLAKFGATSRRRPSGTRPRPQPPFANGQRVKVTAGEHAGRTGKVGLSVTGVDAAWVEVALDLLHCTDFPKTAIIAANDLEIEAAEAAADR